MVYDTLREAPWLFQVWACKQVMGIAGTMEWDKSTVRVCPSCTVKCDTCAHLLFCCHNGRLATLKHTLELAEEWLVDADTDSDLLDCIMEYAHGRAGKTMESICIGLGPQFLLMAREQDAIGWQCFMEGMISTRLRSIQYNFHHLQGTHMPPKCWARGLIQKLLEATHGQWIYQNIQIHGSVAGTQATLRKEAIQREIEEQMELGMLEVNLRDLETTGGEQEEYWLLAIKAARTAATLTRAQTHLARQPAD
jgi:hypothetical protein